MQPSPAHSVATSGSLVGSSLLPTSKPLVGYGRIRSFLAQHLVEIQDEAGEAAVRRQFADVEFRVARLLADGQQLLGRSAVGRVVLQQPLESARQNRLLVGAR